MSARVDADASDPSAAPAGATALAMQAASIPMRPASDAPIVVLDACVLMSSILRALLLRLARAGVFSPVWSRRIGEEWIRNAARLWQVPVADVTARWAAMQEEFPDADAGDVQPYETGLRYSDPKDHHVIAAGLARRARSGLARVPEVLVATWNLKDFNRPEMRRLGLDAFNPDRLLSQWWERDRAAMRAALQGTAADVASLGRDAEPLDTTLRRERLYRLRALLAADSGAVP